MKPLLAARNLTKSFGSKTVLGPLEFGLVRGEVVAIVGHSGCGKTTFLRIAAGLEEASTGAVFVSDAPLSGTNPLARVMFQEATLVPWKTVLKNVALGVRGGDAAQALDALRQVGLAERAAEWPSVLSGGQRQRVALARALAAHPEILLLDEPLSALDALTRLEMQTLIEAVWQEHRFAVILVTHDVEEAVALADRVLLMEHGQWLVAQPIELARPRNRADPQFVRYKSILLDALLNRRESAVPDPRVSSSAAMQLRAVKAQRAEPLEAMTSLKSNI